MNKITQQKLIVVKYYSIFTFSLFILVAMLYMLSLLDQEQYIEQFNSIMETYPNGNHIVGGFMLMFVVLMAITLYSCIMNFWSGYDNYKEYRIQQSVEDVR